MKHHKWWILTITVILTPIIVVFASFVHHVRLHDAYVRQRAQLNSIDSGIGLFRNECDGYPPSDANDPTGLPYCGAMKLAEALMGQDLLGFHSESVFRRDGLDAAGQVDLYPDGPDGMDPSPREDLEARRGPYLQVENAKACRLADVYGPGRTGPFPGEIFVLCDTFEKKRPSGRKTGMPILYYRAHPDRKAHDVNDPDNPASIYDYRDNQALITLGVPGKPKAVHPLADPRYFYRMIEDPKSSTRPMPFRPDMFILISAGYDGEYGTPDDILDFA